MKTFFPILLFIISLSVACAKQDKLSIEEKKLIEILADIHVAEAAYQSLPKALKDSLSVTYYEQIFEIHGITRTEFDQNIAVLKSNPAQMTVLYGKVMNQLNEDEKRFNQ